MAEMERPPKGYDTMTEEAMKILRSCIIIAGAILFAYAALCLWANRYDSKTAGGRYFKHDRWTGRTFIIDKDGAERAMKN